MVEILDTVQLLARDYEPKRKFRWIIELDGIDAFTAKSASRPSFTTDPIEIGFINDTRWVPGKTKPGTVSMTLIDSIDPSASQKVMEWIRLQYDPSTGRAAYSNTARRDLTLKMLGPVGDVVEQWNLKGCFITESNFGDLSYEDSAVSEIALTLQPSRAVLEW